MKKTPEGGLRTDRRLIEEWLPIAELSEESTRERRAMTALPPTYYLHVWWARRPLVASRAAVLGSLLPENVDREKFLHVLGIHGDPVSVRRRIDVANRTGEDLGADPYGYKRAFLYSPSPNDLEWIRGIVNQWVGEPTVLDPTAGGGSIPFEARRLGHVATLANDLNPVAALVLQATAEWPQEFGRALPTEFEALAKRFVLLAEPKYERIFPEEPRDRRIVGYLHAHTVRCPYCLGLVPLSPNWRLAPGGTGVQLRPHTDTGHGSKNRVCTFEIVGKASDQSPGTVSGGTATCPYPDCGQVIDGDEIKRQAQDGAMGSQLYGVIYKRRVKKILKSGKRGKDRWVRRYRTPTPEDDNSGEIQTRLDEKLPEWEAFDIIPSERFPEASNDSRPIQYGMPFWRDMFSPRQLLCHGTSVEVYRNMLAEDRREEKLTPVRKAAYVYLAFAIDKLINRNCRMTRWAENRIVGKFDRHDYAFKWSYSEMAPLVVGDGYDWVIGQTAKAIGELVRLAGPQSSAAVQHHDLFSDNGNPPAPDGTPEPPPPITITCKSADNLDHLGDASIDAIVMDPPWEANVMYAELSDFFYVWLKRTAGHVFPEAFPEPAHRQGQRGGCQRRSLQGAEGRRSARNTRLPGTHGGDISPSAVASSSLTAS